MVRHIIIAGLLVLTAAIGTSCQSERSSDAKSLALRDAEFTRQTLEIVQELTNDAPLGPGKPQPSEHCPSQPGTWIAGSGRSTGTSNVFGDLKELEVYCINAERGELSGGIATWTDSAGDTISMYFGAKLLDGFAYAPAPNAPIIGYAHFTGGTGRWTGITGDALLTGNQNGDGTATLVYQGTIYLPK